jgi:hypothetical protein
MQYPPINIFVEDATVLPAVSPLDSNKIEIAGRTLDKRYIQVCNASCPGNNVTQVTRIKVTAPSASLDPLDKVTGFKVVLKRNGELENATLYPIQREHLYNFDFEKNPNPTAAEIVAEFVLQNQNFIPSFEEDAYVTMSVDPSDGTGETLLLVANDNNLFDISKLRGSLLTVTKVVEGVSNRISQDEVLRNFPVQPQINGGRIGGTYGSIGTCKPYCMLFVKECLPSCETDDNDTLDTFGTTGAINRYQIWVDNSNPANFDAWLAALAAEIPLCGGPCTAQWQETFTAPVAGSVDIIFDVDGTDYPLTATLDLNDANIANDLVGEIREILEGAPFNVSPYDLVVEAAQAGGDWTITISGIPRPTYTAVTIEWGGGAPSSQALTKGADTGNC